MSWSQFANLISEGNRDVAAWKVAIEGNPNTPEGALKIAINHFIRNGDVAAIDDLCSFVVLLVNQAVQQRVQRTCESCGATDMFSEDICIECGASR